MMDIGRRRRSYSSRQFLLEKSIMILEKFFSSNFNDEDISTLIINNELPNDIRSILWRCYLGILPIAHSKNEWITKTIHYREEFDKIVNQENFQITLNFYNSQLNNDMSDSTDMNCLNFNFENEFKILQSELENYSVEYDIFKFETVKKTFLNIFLVWRYKNNYELEINTINFMIKILAIFIYTLYTNIIHLSQDGGMINENESDSKNIFYFLNLEDYFDHDIFEIYQSFLKKGNLQELIFKYNKGILENNLNSKISQISNNDSNLLDNLDELFEKININSEISSSNNNLIEKISYEYFFVINKNILAYLLDKKFDLYNFIAHFFLSGFYNLTKFENITYYLDNIIMHSRKEELNFLGYLILSSFILLEDEIINLNKEEIENLYLNFPLIKSDPKDFVNKALRIREKINKKFKL